MLTKFHLSSDTSPLNLKTFTVSLFAVFLALLTIGCTSDGSRSDFSQKADIIIDAPLNVASGDAVPFKVSLRKPMRDGDTMTISSDAGLAYDLKVTGKSDVLEFSGSIRVKQGFIRAFVSRKGGELLEEKLDVSADRPAKIPETDKGSNAATVKYIGNSVTINVQTPMSNESTLKGLVIKGSKGDILIRVHRYAAANPQFVIKSSHPLDKSEVLLARKISTGNIAMSPVGPTKLEKEQSLSLAKKLGTDKENVDVYIPIFSKNLSVNIKSSFKQIYKGGDKRAYMMEFIPEGQTTGNWTDMITVQGFKGMGKVKNMTLTKFMYGFSNLEREKCKKNHSFKDLGGHRGPGYSARLYVSGCRKIENSDNPNVPVDISEHAIYFLVDGGDDYFSLSYSLRGKSGEFPYNNKNLNKYLSAMLPIRVCDKKMNFKQCVESTNRKVAEMTQE